MNTSQVSVYPPPRVLQMQFLFSSVAKVLPHLRNVSMYMHGCAAIRECAYVVGGLGVEVVDLCACVLYFLCNTLIMTIFPPLQPPLHPLPPPLLSQNRRLPIPEQVSRAVSVGRVSVHTVTLVVHMVNMSEVLCNCCIDTAGKLFIFFVCVWESQTASSV